MRYRNVSGHADDDAEGRVFEVNGFLDFSDEQLEFETNKTKIEEGLWIPVDNVETGQKTEPSRQELMAQAKELDITGRSNLSNDELHTAIIKAEQEQKGDSA